MSARDLYRTSCLSDDDLVKSELINDELSGSMSFYCEKVSEIDDIDLGNPLLSKRLLEEKRPGKLSLDGIFTTGTPSGRGGKILFFLNFVCFFLDGGEFPHEKFLVKFPSRCKSTWSRRSRELFYKTGP